MKVFLVGFSLIFVGVIVMMIAALIHGFAGSAGLIVFVGPIPIILGIGEYSLLAVVLAIIFTILTIAFFIVLRKQKGNGILHPKS